MDHCHQKGMAFGGSEGRLALFDGPAAGHLKLQCTADVAFAHATSGGLGHQVDKGQPAAWPCTQSKTLSAL